MSERYYEIGSPEDPVWRDWMAIYLTSFPESERMSEAALRCAFDVVGAEQPVGTHALALLDGDTAAAPTVAIAYYEITADRRTALLWYLATRADCRGRGTGERLYREILRRVRSDGATLLLLEVEIPAAAGSLSSAEEDWARRRIEWYRRLGARVLDGIVYDQEVDTGVPPTPMWLMAHPLSPISADDVYTRAKSIFADALQRVGPLTLT